MKNTACLRCKRLLLAPSRYQCFDEGPLRARSSHSITNLNANIGSAHLGTVLRRPNGANGVAQSAPDTNLKAIRERAEEYDRTSTRPKPTDSRLHSNCVVGAYLGTGEPYLRAMASAGARRYQSNRSSKTECKATEPDPRAGSCKTRPAA